jgi:hypothetical protein
MHQIFIVAVKEEQVDISHFLEMEMRQKINIRSQRGNTKAGMDMFLVSWQKSGEPLIRRESRISC